MPRKTAGRTNTTHYIDPYDTHMDQYTKYSLLLLSALVYKDHTLFKRFMKIIQRLIKITGRQCRSLATGKQIKRALGYFEIRFISICYLSGSECSLYKKRQMHERSKYLEMRAYITATTDVQCGRFWVKGKKERKENNVRRKVRKKRKNDRKGRSEGRPSTAEKKKLPQKQTLAVSVGRSP